MNESDALLVELLLQADVFCNQVEAIGKEALDKPDSDILRLRLNQCRATLEYLQKLYEIDELAINDQRTCATFRSLIMSLLWVTFAARQLIGHRLFRKLVQIESGFTYALISNRK